MQRRWDYNARQDVHFARLLAPFYGPQERGADQAGFAEPTPLQRWQGAGCLFALVVLLVWALLSGASWELQRYQTKDYVTLPARVQAATPTYASALGANDGIWPTQKPTKNYACGNGFVKGAYQISGTDDNNFGYAQAVVDESNSAIAVTVSESGAIKANDNDGK
ncbi:MAG: hypothetical protein ABI068_07190 [Ktedonobacterales bacterium]